MLGLGTTGLAELPGSRVVAGFETRKQAEDAARTFGRGTVSIYDPKVVPTPEPSRIEFNLGRVVGDRPPLTKQARNQYGFLALSFQRG